MRPLGGSLYSSLELRVEYKLPPKGRTTNDLLRRFSTSLMSPPCRSTWASNPPAII